MSFVRSGLPKFPCGWRTVEFEEAILDATGGHPKVQTKDYLPAGRLPVIDQGQSEIAGYVDDENLRCNVDLPVILFGDHTRLFKFADRPFALGADGVKVLSPSAGLDARFVYRYLNAVKLPEDAGYSRHFKYLRQSLVPIPPLAEQWRIADILDKADAIRRKRREALALTEDLLRATFLEMFGDLSTNIRSLPVVPLEQVIREGTMITYGIVQAGPHIPGGVPYIRTGDIKGGKIVTEGLLRTSPEIATRYKRSEVRAGDIVMSIRATVGTVAIVPEVLDGANLTQGTARISPGMDVEPAYLFAHLGSVGTRRWIAANTKGVTFKEITLGALRQLPVMLPPRKLQEDFSARSRAISTIRERAEQWMVESERLFDALVHRAFCGEL